MKKTLCVLMLVIAFVSCDKKTDSKVAENKTVDTLKIDPSDLSNLKISKKNLSQYDEYFIKMINKHAQMNDEKYELFDDKLVRANDTISFSTEIELSKTVVLKGSDDNKSYALKLTRKNLTNLAYEFKITDKNNKVINELSGEAILEFAFFEESKTEQDALLDEEYFVAKYEHNFSDCVFEVLLGEKDSDGKLRAKATFSCFNDESKNLDSSKCPTLREE